MKKTLWILVCLCGLLSQQAAAQSDDSMVYVSNMDVEETEQYAFVGLEGGYLNLKQNLGTEEIYLPASDEKKFLGLRVGLQSSVWRTMFTYEDNFDSYRAFLIEADRTIVAGLMENRGRIYLGVSGGWIEYYGQRELDSVLVDFEDYGYAFGGNFGFMLYLSDQVDLSIDYRYLFTSSSCTLDDIHGFSVSLHYFF